jgi:integrase
MKANREHRAPLSERAAQILAEARVRGDGAGGYVFPGVKRGRPLSSMSMEMLLRRMKVEGATVHGFRSSFRDWAGDRTHFPREVAEAALAHAVGDGTELSYRRGDALEKRRELMEAWTDFLAGGKTAKIVKFGRK